MRESGARPQSRCNHPLHEESRPGRGAAVRAGHPRRRARVRFRGPGVLRHGPAVQPARQPAARRHAERPRLRRRRARREHQRLRRALRPVRLPLEATRRSPSTRTAPTRRPSRWSPASTRPARGRSSAAARTCRSRSSTRASTGATRGCARRSASTPASCPSPPTPNANGVLDVDDFKTETGKAKPTAQDLIEALSDGVDDDGNGYVDDIAGWDFFDDDNDPTRHLVVLRGGRPRHRPREGGRRARQRRPGLDRRLPEVPVRPAAHLGHVRERPDHLRRSRSSTRPTSA